MSDRTVLTHRYEPRGAALTLMHARDDEVLLSGPAGTGKSRACLEKVHMMALINPGMRGLIVRKTLASLGSTALVTWRRFVIAEAVKNGTVSYYGGSSEEPPQYRYSNGSSIVIGGMDKPSKIMSSEYDLAYVQEAIELTEEDWEAITTRLRNGVVSFQQLIADTNPDRPHHWLKIRCDSGACRLIESRHEDNPTLFGDNGRLTERGASYIGKLDKLTGPRYYRLRKGLWVAAEGVIYEDFDPAIHVLESFIIPADWARYWSVDFGYVNPFTIQCWAEDPDGRLYLYRELYHTKRTSDQHAQQMLDIVAPGGVWLESKPRAIICDHDAEGRALFERTIKLATRPADKKVVDGIQRTQKRFRKEGDGKPRIFLLRDCLIEQDKDLKEASKPTCLAEELTGYIWDPAITKSTGRKDTPLKIDDHGCDGMRYIVMQRDPMSRPGIRVMG